MKTILVDAVGTFVIEGTGVYKPIFDLLEKYPNRKIILTNANDDEMEPYGLVDLPYEFFTLKHNPDKTEPEYFVAMFKHLKLIPEEVVYFEHNPEAVKSAQSQGVTSYYYDSDKKDLKALASFLNDNL